MAGSDNYRKVLQRQVAPGAADAGRRDLIGGCSVDEKQVKVAVEYTIPCLNHCKVNLEYTKIRLLVILLENPVLYTIFQLKVVSMTSTKPSGIYEI